MVERFLGKKKVVGSIPTPGSKNGGGRSWVQFPPLAHAKEKTTIDKTSVFRVQKNKLLQEKIKERWKEKAGVEKILQIL